MDLNVTTQRYLCTASKVRAPQSRQVGIHLVSLSNYTCYLWREQIYVLEQMRNLQESNRPIDLITSLVIIFLLLTERDHAHACLP